MGAMGIVQPVRLLRGRACVRRASARHSSDVSWPIDRAKGATQRAICCAGMRGRTFGGLFGDERGHGDNGLCYRGGVHGKGGWWRRWS
jgi:hypothetical protein